MAKAKTKKKALTKGGQDPNRSKKRAKKKAKMVARKAKTGSIEGKKFSELSAGEKATLLQLLGERFGLIVEE